jgi:hypothetical protein
MRKRTTRICLPLGGLMLLASLGLSSCQGDMKGRLASGPGVDSGLRDEVVEAWRVVDETWNLGSEYAWGRCGLWPFDKVNKDALLKRLGQFDRQVATLVKLKALRQIEADALCLEFEFLHEQIQLVTAFDLREGYSRDKKPSPKELKRVEEWLADLEAIRKVDKPHREIIDYVIDEAEMKAHDLTWCPISVSSYATHQRREMLAAKLRAYGRKLRKIPTRTSPALTEDKDWRILVQVLDPDYDADSAKRPKLGQSQAVAIVEKLGKQKVLIALEVRSMRRVLQSFSDRSLQPFEDEGLYDAGAGGGGDYDLEMFVDYEEQWFKGIIKLLGELRTQKSIPRSFGKIVRDTVELDMCRYGALSPFSSCRWRLFGNSTSRSLKEGRLGFERDKKIETALGKIDSLSSGDMTALASSDHWKRIVAAQTQAASLAGRIWRVSRMQRRRLRELFVPLDKSIAALVEQRLLTKAEAAILQRQRMAFVAVLDYDGDYWLTSTEGMAWEFDACSRLARRAGLIEKLTSLRRSDWRVVRRVLVMTRGDIDRVAEAIDAFEENSIGPQVKEVLRRMKGIVDSARGAVARLGKRLPVTGEKLAQTHRWKQVTDFWRDVQALSAWDTHQRVLNGMGNMMMLGRGSNALSNVETLRSAKLLSDVEAELLKEDLKVFLKIVRSQYYWGIGMISCDGLWSPYPDYSDNWKSLVKRIELLEKLCSADRTRTDVVTMLLYMVEVEVDMSAGQSVGPKVTQEDVDWECDLRRQMIEAIAKLRARLKRPASPLKTNRKWADIVNLCTSTATAITEGIPTMQHRALRIRLAQAGIDAYQLYATGALNSLELRMAIHEIMHLRQALTFLPPTDFGKGFHMSQAPGWFTGDIIDCQDIRRTRTMSQRTDPSLAKILRATLEMDLTIMERSHVPPRLEKLKYDWFNDSVKSIKAMLAKTETSKK